MKRVEECAAVVQVIPQFVSGYVLDMAVDEDRPHLSAAKAGVSYRKRIAARRLIVIQPPRPHAISWVDRRAYHDGLTRRTNVQKAQGTCRRARPSIEKNQGVAAIVGHDMGGAARQRRVAEDLVLGSVMRMFARMVEHGIFQL